MPMLQKSFLTGRLFHPRPTPAQLGSLSHNPNGSTRHDNKHFHLLPEAHGRKTMGFLPEMIYIWYPFECDMGLDGTLTSHIERVADELDIACQSAI